MLLVFAAPPDPTDLHVVGSANNVKVAWKGTTKCYFYQIFTHHTSHTTTILNSGLGSTVSGPDSAGVCVAYFPIMNRICPTFFRLKSIDSKGMSSGFTELFGFYPRKILFFVFRLFLNSSNS